MRLPDETYSYFEYYPVTSAEIRAAAENTNSRLAAVERLRTGVEREHRHAIDAVEGELQGPVSSAPRGVTAGADNVAQVATFAVGALEMFAGHVDTYNYTSTHPRSVSQLNAEYSRQVSDSFGQPAAEYPAEATESRRAQISRAWSTGYQAKKAAVMDGLTAEYARLGGNLDMDAEAVVGMLGRGPNSADLKTMYGAGALPSSAALVFPGVNFSGVPITELPYDLRGLTGDELAGWLLAQPELDPSLVRAITDLRSDATDALGDLIADEASGLDLDSSDRDLSRVVEMLDRFSPYAAIAAATTLSLGAEDMLHLISMAGRRHLGGDDNAEDLARSLRDTFWSGESAMSDTDRAAYATGLVDYFRRSVFEHSEDDTSANDACSLSFLLRDGTFSTPFLDTMGDELDAFERDFPDGYSWRQMTTGALGIGGFFAAADRDGAFDPLTSYMSALGNNGEASLQFFTEGDGRAEYWIKERHWGHDDFNGLLQALDAATTASDTRDDPAARQLVSEAVDHLANRGSLEFHGDDEQFNPGDVGAEGTKSLAHMVGSYLPSVDVALQEQLPDSSQLGENGLQPITDHRIGNLSNMPVFEASELKQIINVTVSHEDGFVQMRDMLSHYQSLQLTNTVMENGYVDADTSNADARLEGFFVNAVGDTDLAEAAERDARVQAWIDLGEDAAGMIPVPGGSVVGALADQAIDHGAGALSDAYTNAESTAVDSSNDFATTALHARHQEMEKALVNGGALTADDIYQNLHGVTRQDGSTYSRADVEGWLSGGTYPTPTEYDAMAGEDRQALESAIRSLVDHPDSPHDPLIDTTDYDQSYNDMFSEYFEKGDGDGN